MDNQSLAGESYAPATERRMPGIGFSFDSDAEEDMPIDLMTCVVCDGTMMTVEKKWQGKPCHEDGCFPAIRACRRCFEKDEAALEEFDNLLFEDEPAWKGRVQKFLDPKGRSGARKEVQVELVKSKKLRTSKGRSHLDDDALFNEDEFVTMKQSENKFLSEWACRELFRIKHGEQGGEHDSDIEKRILASYKSRGRSSQSAHVIHEVGMEGAATAGEFAAQRAKVIGRIGSQDASPPPTPRIPICNSGDARCASLTTSNLASHQQIAEQQARWSGTTPRGTPGAPGTVGKRTPDGEADCKALKKQRYDALGSLQVAYGVAQGFDLSTALSQVDFFKVLKGLKAAAKIEQLIVQNGVYSTHHCNAAWQS